MGNEARFCGNCGAAMTGPFCGSCGAPAAGQASEADLQDEPTRMVSGDEPTSNRVPAPGPAAAAETGWYQSADASGGNAPYAGYDSGPYAGDPYAAQPAHGASAYSSGYPVAPQPERRSNPTPFIAAGLVSLLVLACLGGYLLMRGGDDKKAAPDPSVIPTSSSPQPSASSSTTSTTTTTQPAPTTQTTTQTQTATATATATVTSTAAQDGSALGDLPGLRNTVVVNGVSYALTQSGRSAQIYSGESGQPTKIADIPLADDPDFEGRPASLELLSLPGCSKPVMTFNSKHTGSAAYGWNGSEYKAFKSLGGGDLLPVADVNDTASMDTYGVYVENGAVTYRDHEDTKPDKYNHFSSCDHANPDYLKED